MANIYDISGQAIEVSNIDAYHLPRLYVEGVLPTTKAQGELSVTVKYVGDGDVFTSYATLKVQGDSSTQYPKKNFTIKLFDDIAHTQKQKHDFKEWGNQNKFVLKANWIDLSHARNIVSARLWADVVRSRSDYSLLPEQLRESPNLGAVDGFPIVMFVNGVYYGRYTWNIAKDKFLYNMDDSLATNVALVGEGGSADASQSALFREAAVVDGSDWTDEIHDTVPTAVVTQLNAFISHVMTSSDSAFISNFGNYADLTSFIDYRCFQDVICGLDSSYKNQVLITYDGLKYYASAYDMDSTHGLYWNGSYFVDYDYPWRRLPPLDKTNLLYDRLESLALPQIKARYAVLRQTALTVTNIIEHFEKFMEDTPPYVIAEDYAETTANGAFTQIPSQSTNNIQQIRDYVVNRLAYVDSELT